MSDRMIVVLGLDGLEYELVEEFRLDKMKLKAHTKTKLDDFDVVVTPPIWASMLTGTVIQDMVRQFKFSMAYIADSDSQLMMSLRQILPARSRNFVGRLGNKVLRSIAGNPMDNTMNYIESRNIGTIFDFAQDPAFNRIPGFNLTTRTKILAAAIMARDFEGFVRKEFLDDTAREEKDLLGVIRERHDLVFWYFHALDSLGHIDFGRKLRMMNYYMRFNSMIMDIMKELDENDILYAVSDHGMRPCGKGGIHSRHGFFSSSTGETISRPYELYRLLIDKLQ